MLAISSASRALASKRACSSSTVAASMASGVLASAVVAPRSPRTDRPFALNASPLPVALALRRIAPEGIPAGEGPDGPARRPRRPGGPAPPGGRPRPPRSEEHTSELQSRENLVCRLLLEKKK